MELESVETIAVSRHEESLNEVKQRHVEEVSVWNEIFAEIADSLVSEVKVANAGSVEMSIEWNMILICFEKHIRALQALVNANMEHKLTITDAIANIMEQLDSVRSMN